MNKAASNAANKAANKAASNAANKAANNAAGSISGAMMTQRAYHLCLLTAAAALLTGCGMTSGEHATPVIAPADATIHGSAYGGQQPVAGASLQLYAANLSGYGNAATALLPANSAMTTANGNFSIPGGYTCPTPDAPIYLVATGGNPGLSDPNPNLAVMAALGSCSAFQANASTTFIQMNEVSTVAAAYALAPFMTSISGMSTSAANVNGLNLAFADVSQLVNTATGATPGPALPSGATLPVAQINSLADSLAACINSSGGTAGDMSYCGTLFTAATPPGGTAPTDTVSAVIDIVQHPGQNVAAIYGLASGKVPFVPTLTSTPNDWTLAVTYTGGGLSAPSAVAVDAGGNIWITNRSANTVTELAHSGAMLSTTGSTLSGPSAIAIDATGAPWMANGTASTLTYLSSMAAGTTGASGGGLNLPSSVAIDPQGNLWIANSGAATVSEFTSAGSPVYGNGIAGSGIVNPLAIAIGAY